jgi:hypothetical protein
VKIHVRKSERASHDERLKTIKGAESLVDDPKERLKRYQATASRTGSELVCCLTSGRRDGNRVRLPKSDGSRSEVMTHELLSASRRSGRIQKCGSKKGLFC